LTVKTKNTTIMESKLLGVFMEKVFKEIEKYILLVLVFLLPVSVFGGSSNPFVIARLEVLFYGVCLYLLIKCLRTVFTGKLEFSVSNYDISALLILVSYLVSALFRTPNKMEAFLLPGTATVAIGAILLFFFINQLEAKSKELVSKTIVISGALFSLWIILAFSGLLSALPLPAYIKAKGFTPEAGYLPAVIYLATTLLLAAGSFITEKHIAKKLAVGFAGFFIVSALILSIYNVLPGKQASPRFPGVGVSWFIAVDSLKSSPIFGVGPGNYLTAFNRFRPASFNGSDLWAVKFSTASNFFLTVLTEVGLLGFAGFIILLFQLFKHSKKDLKEKRLVNWGFASIVNLVSLLLLVMFFVLFPATNLLIVMFFVLLSLNTKTKLTKLNLVAETHDDNESLGTKISSKFPAILVSLPVVLVVGFLMFRSINVVRAEYKFKKSIDSLAKNDTKVVYDVMTQAINLNPRVDRYRAAFSRINLLLANSVVQKKDLTDDQKKALTQLIQVAISESKANVALNPLRSDNWAFLGSTYRSVMPLAKGADDFAIQSYRQAIILEPLNPNLRIALGGVYFAKKDFDSAIAVFRTVTEQVKPDLANGHFNLAYAYKEKGMLDKAVNEMTVVVSLLDKSSKDYEVAQKALTDFQSKKKEGADSTSAGENLTPPQADQKAINAPVELPGGSEPPAAPTISVTPTPTPSVSVESLPSITITPSPTQIP